MPRTHSHGLRWIVGNETYSGVRTSQNGGSGGISPAFLSAWRRAPRSTTLRAAPKRNAPASGFHGIHRSFTTPSGTAA